jgi:hypothetical protein
VHLAESPLVTPIDPITPLAVLPPSVREIIKKESFEAGCTIRPAENSIRYALVPSDVNEISFGKISVDVANVVAVDV